MPNPERRHRAKPKPIPPGSCCYVGCAEPRLHEDRSYACINHWELYARVRKMRAPSPLGPRHRRTEVIT